MWKLQKFTPSQFLTEIFRECNRFTKEVTRDVISRKIFTGRVNILFSNTVLRFYSVAIHSVEKLEIFSHLKIFRETNSIDFFSKHVVFTEFSWKQYKSKFFVSSNYTAWKFKKFFCHSDFTWNRFLANFGSTIFEITVRCVLYSPSTLVSRINWLIGSLNCNFKSLGFYVKPVLVNLKPQNSANCTTLKLWYFKSHQNQTTKMLKLPFATL